ncbi:WG repeat-containing protein [Hymenobacter humi]|uniref:WG repeat-containing protein n=1 Tax=Hymenobacter humi TaxID=1411620 RepID=A0ABW2U684_9BACT
MEASKAESAARNRELDAKIQQLGQLIEQLNSQPAAAPRPSQPAAAAPASAAPPMPPTAPKPRPWAGFRPAPWAAERLQLLQEWRRRRPQAAMAVAGLATLGLGVWGLSHLGSGPLVPYQENGRWGYAKASGTPVISAQFTAAGPFRDGQAVVAKDGAYGIIDEDGDEVIAPAYDSLNAYHGGYARARVGEAYTFLNEEGEEFDHYYFNARDFAEGRAAVRDYRGWHYITGPDVAEAVPAVFLEAYSFVDGLARVKLPDGYTFITPDYLEDPSTGTKPFGRYAQATDFVGGKAWVMLDGRSFIIDKNGEEVK